MSNTRHTITYATAVDYILRFINAYPTTASASVGGYIDRTTLETILANNEANDLYGLLFWYCVYNGTDNAFPAFFLSLTDMDSFDAQNPPASPDLTKEYFRAATIHTFTDTRTSANVEAWLETTDYSGARTAVSITPDETDSMVTNSPGGAQQTSANPNYGGSPCGLFIQEDTGITDLVADDVCVGMNYFFGITDGTNPKICVVLFPVDDNGLNATNRLIFERAFP